MTFNKEYVLLLIGLYVSPQMTLTADELNWHKGTTINDLGGGPEEIEKKNLGGPSTRKICATYVVSIS